MMDFFFSAKLRLKACDFVNDILLCKCFQKILSKFIVVSKDLLTFQKNIFSQNTFWLGTSNHSNQFSKLLSPQKLYFKGRQLGARKT